MKNQLPFFTFLCIRKYLCASLILIIVSLSGTLKAQVPDGTELTIDFTGLSVFEFDDHELTFTDNDETYKMKIDIPNGGIAFVSNSTTKTRLRGKNFVASVFSPCKIRLKSRLQQLQPILRKCVKQIVFTNISNYERQPF